MVEKIKISMNKDHAAYKLAAFLLSSNSEDDTGRIFRNILYPTLIGKQTFTKLSFIDNGAVFSFEDLQSAMEFSKNVATFQDNFLQLETRFKMLSDIERVQCLNSIVKQDKCLFIYLEYAKKFGYINRIIHPFLMAIFLENTQQGSIGKYNAPQALLPKTAVRQNSIERMREFLWRYIVLSLVLTIFSYMALGGKELQKKITNI